MRRKDEFLESWIFEFYQLILSLGLFYFFFFDPLSEVERLFRVFKKRFWNDKNLVFIKIPKKGKKNLSFKLPARWRIFLNLFFAKNNFLSFFFIRFYDFIKILWILVYLWLFQIEIFLKAREKIILRKNNKELFFCVFFFCWKIFFNSEIWKKTEKNSF